jgi:uncharacterized protein (DUF1501 family)
MDLSRRQFVKGAAVFSAAGFAPRFLSDTAAHAAQAISGFQDDRVLVVVQLSGGNDGLNTVVPYGHDEYYRARPNLGLKGDSLLKINEELALHAKLEPLKHLYDDGKLGIVQGIGYPNPNRSHFRSTEIWETASGAEEYLGTGWIGRYFDNNCSGSAKPQVGLALDPERPQSFEGEKGFGISTMSPKQYGWTAGTEADTEETFAALNREGRGGNSTLDFLRHTTTNAVLSSKEVQMAADKGKVAAQIRGGRNSQQLDAIAGLIRGGLDTRIFYASTGGFDTHAGQLNAHEGLLEGVANVLARFQNQLEKDGTADRVVTLVFSEFGRRVNENGSGGTDHGTAAPLFVMGSKVRGGLHGAYPSLTDLDRGDLKYTTDFRQVYATLLTDWFGADAQPVLQESFRSLPLIG